MANLQSIYKILKILKQQKNPIGISDLFRESKIAYSSVQEILKFCEKFNLIRIQQDGRLSKFLINPKWKGSK